MALDRSRAGVSLRPITTRPRFRCDDRWIRDELGRVRIFRGANVSGRSKLPPFLPFDDPACFDPLAEWGWNAVRLLVMWEALEPERGSYDDAYLARVESAAAEAAGERGLQGTSSSTSTRISSRASSVATARRAGRCRSMSSPRRVARGSFTT